MSSYFYIITFPLSCNYLRSHNLVLMYYISAFLFKKPVFFVTAEPGAE